MNDLEAICCTACSTQLTGKYSSGIPGWICHCPNCAKVFLYFSDNEQYNEPIEFTSQKCSEMAKESKRAREERRNKVIAKVTNEVFDATIAKIFKAVQEGSNSCTTVSIAKWKDEYVDIPDAESIISASLLSKLTALGFDVTPRNDYSYGYEVKWSESD